MEIHGLLLVLLPCIAVGCALFFVIRNAACGAAALPVTADWIEELSVDRYRPMLRLLAEDEFRTAALQAGASAALVARMRRQRCQIFRGYLRSLRGDFGRVLLALKLLMVQASQDRPDLAATLLRSQLQFGCGMAMVQARLTLYQWGIGTVDASSVLRVFDGLRMELRTLVPASAGLQA